MTRMANTRRTNAVRLEFEAGSQVQINLSGAAFCGDWLFVAGDEAAGIDRLERLPPTGRGERLRGGQQRASRHEGGEQPAERGA